MVALCFLLLWKSPQTSKTAPPTKHHLPSPAAASSAASTTPAAHSRGCCLTLQWPMVCPGLATHTLAGLCALWLRNAASSSDNLHKPEKLQYTHMHLPSSAAAPSTGTTRPAAHCRGCISPCSAPWHAQGWPLTHLQGSLRFSWQGSLRRFSWVLPPHLGISTNQQNRTPHEPPPRPCCSPQ